MSNQSWTEEAILEHIEETYDVKLSRDGQGWRLRPQITWSSNDYYYWRSSRNFDKARLSFRLGGSDLNTTEANKHTRGSLLVCKLTKEKLQAKIDGYVKKAEQFAKDHRDYHNLKNNRHKEAKHLIREWGLENLGVALSARPYGKHEVSYTALFDDYETLFRFMVKDGQIHDITFVDSFKLDDEVNDLLVRISNYKVNKRLEQKKRLQAI